MNAPLIPWPQELYELLGNALEHLGNLLTSEPDMPSHERTTMAAQEFFDTALRRLKEEDMLHDFLEGFLSD